MQKLLYIYPFGSPISNRSFSASSYRYGFNGKEKDDEVNVNGGDYDFGARIYDSRLGRWLAIDPMQIKYSSWSPYNYTFNSPILLVDLAGRDVIQAPSFEKNNTYQKGFKLFQETDVAKTFLTKFASANGNLFTTDVTKKTGTDLSKHNVNFVGNVFGSDPGETSIMIWDEKTSDFIPFSDKTEVSASCKFQINIGIDIETLSGFSTKDQGYAAGTIAHEVFTHANALATILENFEKSPKTPEDVDKLKTALNDWNKKETGYKAHEDLGKGLIKEFNSSVNQMKKTLEVTINKTDATKEAKSEAKDQKKGLVDAVEEDVSGGFETTDPKK